MSNLHCELEAMILLLSVSLWFFTTAEFEVLSACCQRFTLYCNALYVIAFCSISCQMKDRKLLHQGECRALSRQRCQCKNSGYFAFLAILKKL